MKHTSLAAFSTTLLLAAAASATPRATEAQRIQVPGVPATPPPYVAFGITHTQATAQIAKIAAWDVTMQATDCTNPEAGIDGSMTACERGGIIEVETGPGHSIVESDNTQETIGLWSENQMLGGKAYLSNITLAFDYLATHPGYLEWRDDPMATGPDYYSVYNCGWGVRAVMLYEATTGDMSDHTYGVTCANHIAVNAAALVDHADGGAVDPGAALINVGPAAWAASGLWAWGETYSDASARTAAAGIGALVKAWIEATPDNLSAQSWAITGGAPFYGVVESYMKEHPTELTAWVTEFAPKLGGWVDESKPTTGDWTDWRNAYAAWNMLAQFTASDVLGPKAGAGNLLIAQDVLGKLVAQANPMTGAIAGSQQRPSTEAESWITAYMVYFGLLQIIAEPAVDAGADAGADAGGDAGPRDSGTRPKDASSLHDSAADATPGGEDEGGGCSCGMAGAIGPSGAPIVVLLGLLLLASRRRAQSS